MSPGNPFSTDMKKKLETQNAFVLLTDFRQVERNRFLAKKL